jgi:L-lysine 2,3-aminomutase
MPFRTNEYVLGTLIDWNNIPDDPIFRMTFPHKDMLLPDEYQSLKQLIEQDDSAAIKRRIEAIWLRMNPHPAGQLTHNGVTLDGKVLPGIQHKYRETVLFFPGAGQTVMRTAPSVSVGRSSSAKKNSSSMRANPRNW